MKMDGGRTPMNTVSRRTRSRWDEYYRINYSKKDQESGSNGGSGKEVRNAVDSDYADVSGDNWENRDFVIVGEKRGGLRNNVALEKKRKLDTRAKIDGDAVLESDRDVIFLGEQVVSNGSSLKTGLESGSGSGSKVGNLNEVVSSITKKDGSRADSGGSSGHCGRGRPRTEPSDGKQMNRDVSVDSENCIGAGNSTGSSDASDKSVDSDLSESESTSEEDDELSDEDYKAGKSSSSESSSDSDGSSDAELEEDDEDDGGEKENVKKGEEENLSNKVEDKRTLCTHGKGTRLNARKESDTEQEKNDESCESYIVDDQGSRHCNRSSIKQITEDAVIIINEKGKFRGFRSPSISMEKVTEAELERGDGIDEGYHETNGGGGHNQTSSNWKKDEDVVIIIDDDEKFPSIMKSAKKNQKGDGELDGSTTIFEPRSNYGCMNKAKRDRDTARNVSKKVEGNLKEIGLKKRNAFGLDVLVDSDRSNDIEKTNVEKCLRPSRISKSEEKDPELGKYNSPVPINSAPSPDHEHKSSRGDDCCHAECIVKRGQQCSEKKVELGRKKSRAVKNLDFIKILVESMNAHREKQFTIDKNALTQETLPSKFKFEDEVVPPPEKSEWEKFVDSLFRDLELGLRESEIDCADCAVMENDDLDTIEIDESPAACCDRGEHQPILDEQIGIVCKYCAAVILDIKYVLPPFYVPPNSGRRDWKESDEPPSPLKSQIQFPSSNCKTPNSFSCARGTVWDLIPGVEEEMYPHQREGFEFIWKNIAGDIIIEKMKQPLSDGRGCIISHAPGTGKTRLTIVFLQTFLKLCPTCCPVIIAPRGMLLTWESEFRKWKFDIPFHNMNKKELSGYENAVATEIFGHVGAGVLGKECIRLLKLYSWTRGGSILGISYPLFEKLAGENGKAGLHEKIREVLLECPDLLVLDEGHTPRNDKSLIWKALTKVATQRRIILSGTPFQNNLIELYNTLCLVNPKFVNQMGSENSTTCKTSRKDDSVTRKRWTSLTSSIGKSRDDGLEKLRAMLDPFVHVHKGTILQENLLGLRHTLVFLHPTECQKTVLETSSKVKNIFRRIRLVSLVSVHPSLEAAMKRPGDKSKLEETYSDVDAGVKMKFLMQLIWLADALGERVLVFSQFLDPLVFIKKQIESQLSWNEGREVLYMDGQLDEKQRQDSISSFNDDTSEAKVLLASERACSEGINLIGASRVVLLDTVWNPSVEKQAISRAYRLGQKKVVYVYRLFTSGIEVRQFAQQIKKERISQLIFSPEDEQTCRSEKPAVVSEDKVLDAMRNLEKFDHIFEKIICQPRESDLIEIFGLEEQN